MIDVDSTLYVRMHDLYICVTPTPTTESEGRLRDVHTEHKTNWGHNAYRNPNHIHVLYIHNVGLESYGKGPLLLDLHNHHRSTICYFPYHGDVFTCCPHVAAVCRAFIVLAHLGRVNSSFVL